MAAPLVILVVGRPASGKTTTARRIARRFGLPLLAKDDFKEILLDRLGPGDRPWSMSLGRAAFDLLDHAIEQQLTGRCSFVVEAPYDARFEDAKHRSWQQRFGFRSFQVHCIASDEVLVERFIERARSGRRHPGHADGDGVDEFRATLGDARVETLALAGEVVELDVAEPMAVERVLDLLAIALDMDG